MGIATARRLGAPAPTGIAGLVAGIRAGIQTCKLCPAMRPFRKLPPDAFGTTRTGYVLVAEALQVPGAARVWIVHNHPSGDANLSQPDRLLNSEFVRRFKDTGLEHMGVMAIGAGELGTQVYQFQDNQAQVHDGIVRLEEPVGTVPIRERELVAQIGRRLFVDKAGPIWLAGKLDAPTGARHGPCRADVERGERDRRLVILGQREADISDRGRSDRTAQETIWRVRTVREERNVDRVMRERFAD